MTSDAHPRNSPPNDAHSPATPKAVARFGLYQEYLAKLERPFAAITLTIHDELWLASFDRNGRCMEWNYCDPCRENSLNVPTSLPALNGIGVRPHRMNLSGHGFRTVLQTPDENVAYRVVLVTAGHDAITPETRDILGLGLDLRPEVFEYAQNCVYDPIFGTTGTLPRPWHRGSPALRIGQNVLCILEAGPGTASKTGIRNLPVSCSRYLTGSIAIIFLGGSYFFGVLGPRVSTS